MSQKGAKPLNEDELDWIQLRRELDEVRRKDETPSMFRKDCWFVPFGAAVTVVFFCYGLYHMNHPTKSIIGAYLRIASQGLTGCGIYYVFTKMFNQKMPKKVNLGYHD